MNIDSLISHNHLYLATFGVSLLSGLVPLINIEVYLLAVGSLSSASPVPVILLTTLGQMLGKCILYLSGKGLLKVRTWFPKRLERAREALDRHQGHAGGVVFMSALSGIPPFYAISILAGALRIPLARFLVLGTVGRILRFSVVLLAPRFFKAVT